MTPMSLSHVSLSHDRGESGRSRIDQHRTGRPLDSSIATVMRARCRTSARGRL